MSLRKRIILIASLLASALTLAALAVAGYRLERAERARAEESLEAAVGAGTQLAADRIDRLTLEAEVLAEILPHTGVLSVDAQPQDLVEIVRQLESNRSLPDLLVITPTHGRPASAAQSLTTEEIVASGALDRIDGGNTQGLLAIGTRFFEFVARPINDPMTESRLGFVVVGSEVEPRIAERLGEQSESEVVLVAGGQSIGSSLSLGTAAEAIVLVPELSTGGSQEVELRGTRYLARFVPLARLFPESSENHPGAGVLLLRPIGTTPIWTDPLLRDLLLLGLATLLLGLPLLWLTSRRIERSLTRLTEAIARGAASGRLQEEFTGYVDEAGAPEIDGLRDALRSLMNKFELIQRDREKSYVEAIGAVVAAIDARDHETTGHSFRVAHYACALARVVGIEGEDLRAIEWGALLHDVGKIAVPDAILRKNGSLTDEEWHVMRQHPNWGFEMLADVEFLKPALEIVYSHHERWDGNGYPRGLTTEEIPLAARIFAVVDTYDSITSDRPYRRAKSHADAVAELCRVAGQQLDPEMVEAFVRVPEAEIRRLRELSEQLDLSTRIPDALTVEVELSRV